MMVALEKKIDFIGWITVKRANPNGDPLNGNQPRTDYDNYGEISDVCLKRKIRNRLQDAGEKILVQSDDRTDDGFDCIRARVEGNPATKKSMDRKAKEEERQQRARRQERLGYDGHEVPRGVRRLQVPGQHQRAVGRGDGIQQG